MRKNKIFIIAIFVLLFINGNPVLCFSNAQAQEVDKLGKAISLYQHENYEEALVLLKSLKAENPQSSNIAYYLGLTYKKLQDLKAAQPHLEAAATLQPPVKNAITELIDLFYQCEKIDEAKKWIETAEKESVSPAQTAFLKGLVLLKEKKDIEGAIASFDEAEKLDESLSRAVAYYKGLAYMQMERLADAKDLFRQIVTKEPTADLAAFANEYVEAITRKEDLTKPFHGNVGFATQYDDNVILKPTQDSLATGIGDEGDWRNVYTCQGEYNLRPTDYFGIKAASSFYYAKQMDLGFYDMLSADFSLYPSVYIDSVMVGFPVHYNYVRINDKHYLDLVGLGNVNNVMVGRDNMVQFALQHNRKYYDWTVTRDNDERDAREYLWSLGWFYFFAKNREGFVQVRYAMNYEDAKGNNWTYLGNRLTAGSTIPFSKKIRWSVVGDYFRQDFAKTNTTYEKDRHDDVITVSNMVAIEVFKDCEIQLQHAFVNDAATIGIFQYRRNIYSVGVKYEF